MKKRRVKYAGLIFGMLMLAYSGCASIPMETSNLVYRAKGMISNGDLRESIPVLKKALAMSPKDVEANVTMARAQYSLGSFKAAKKYAQKALSVHPNEFRAMGTLGLVNLQEGACKRGFDLLSRAIKIYNGIEPVGGNLPVEPTTFMKQMQDELKQGRKISKNEIGWLASAFWYKVDWYEFDEEYRKWHFRSFYEIRPDGGGTIP